MLEAAALPGPLDHDPPHGLRRGAEEMPPAIPQLGRLLFHQPQIGFVDEGHRLQRLTLATPAELGCRELARLGDFSWNTLGIVHYRTELHFGAGCS